MILAATTTASAKISFLARRAGTGNVSAPNQRYAVYLLTPQGYPTTDTFMLTH